MGATPHQRPRLDGAGLADSAVPASLGGLPVDLDAAGRITSLRGVTLAYSGRGYLIEANPPVPEIATRILVDAQMNRVLKATADGAAVDWYVYEGMDRVARLDRFGGVVESTLFDGIDHPLRVNRSGVRVFYELDLAGNVRRLRGAAGVDLGGYRYSAFGTQLEDSASAGFEQDLRWKGRPRDALGGGLETYDMRAREWVPAAGVFVAVDELLFHRVTTTLWGWPAQSTLRFPDPFGRGESGGGGSTDDFGPKPEPKCKEKGAKRCINVGSGGCNVKRGAKSGTKRCTYNCEDGSSGCSDLALTCGPGNWDPPCPETNGGC